MAILRPDPAEMQYHELNKIYNNPDILLGHKVELMIDAAISLFNLCHKPELIKELDKIIKHKLTSKMGRPLNDIIHTYMNFKYLYSYTNHPLNSEIIFYRPRIRELLKEINKWIKERADLDCVPVIRFTLPNRQMIT